MAYEDELIYIKDIELTDYMNSRMLDNSEKIVEECFRRAASLQGDIVVGDTAEIARMLLDTYTASARTVLEMYKIKIEEQKNA